MKNIGRKINVKISEKMKKLILGLPRFFLPGTFSSLDFELVFFFQYLLIISIVSKRSSDTHSFFKLDFHFT